MLHRVRVGTSQVRSLSTAKGAFETNPLKYPHLLQTKGFINGEFTTGKASGNFAVTNPANSQVIAEVPRMGVADTKAAIKAAHDAWTLWRQTTPVERARYLVRYSELMTKYRDDLALILTLEAGKPLAEAKGELAYAQSFVDYYAEEAKRVHGEILTTPAKNRRLMAIKQPVGPVGLITPWNFPSAMITRKLAPALAAGCTAVIKPAEDTPLSALALCVIAQEAGIPPGVVNCVTVAREEVVAVGHELCHSKHLRKISFTGSTAVGKWLMRESASTVKKVSLELGGNAAFIVFEDADLDHAVQALLFAKFRNAGQACIAANRILVQASVYDAFAQKLSATVRNLKVGDGTQRDSVVGPLINKQGLEKVVQQVKDSVHRGAKVQVGGEVVKDLNDQGGFFFQPTVMTGMKKEMLPFSQETFGPLAPLFSFKTEEEAIALANESDFGLAAYLCTRDLARGWRVAEELETGIVGVNDGAVSLAHTPFGGVKESGLGREGGHWGIQEYLEDKYISVNLGYAPAPAPAHK